MGCIGERSCALSDTSVAGRSGRAVAGVSESELAVRQIWCAGEINNAWLADVTVYNTTVR